MGQTLRGEGGVGPFQLLFETGGEFVTNLWMLYYDVSPDGEGFLMIREAGPTGQTSPTQIHVVLNWFEELERRVPTVD